MNVEANFYYSKTRLLLDFHTPEWHPEILSRFDAKKIVEIVKKSSVDCLTFYAKDHYGHCYYNTKVGHKHKNMGDRDFLAEVIAEANARGLMVQIYYTVNFQVNVKDESYLAKDGNGKFIKYSYEGVQRWDQVCYNSMDYLEFCLTQIRELSVNYEASSIWIDMFNYPFDRIACYCDKCRRAFKEQYGYDNLPASPTWDKVWRDFLDFRFKANYEFALKIRKEIKKIKPDMVAIFNYHGGPHQNWLEGQKPVMHSSYSDFTSHEIYPNEYGTMYSSIVPRYLRGVQPGKPAEILTSRFNYSWDYTLKPKAQYTWEVMTALANGVSIVTVDQPLHTGELDESVYKLIRDVYSYANSRKNVFKGNDPKLIAVYYSVKTRDFYARDNKEEYSLSFNGAMKALLEEHYPVDVLFDENLASLDISQYKVLVLANVAILNDEEIEKIKHFVVDGGILIATDETSLYDENGDRLTNYRLSEIFGVDHAGKTKFRRCFFKTPENYSRDIDQNYSILVDGPGNIINANNKFVSLSGSLEIPFYEPGDAMFYSHNLHPRWREVGPALVMNTYQSGKVFYIPFKIFRSYANRYMLPEHRKFIRNIIDGLNLELPIKVIAPLNVEVVIKEDSENYYIHLLGYNPTKQIFTQTNHPDEPIIIPFLMMEEPLIYTTEIEINVPYIRFEVEGDSSVLEKNSNRVRILIKDVYESIKISKKQFLISSVNVI
ncbi:MAG: alpha-L-fucosidase [Actinobacteria bacterium]|nr:alpha-L-fucosidase [Actinomycetota bacterium]